MQGGRRETRRSCSLAGLTASRSSVMIKTEVLIEASNSGVTDEQKEPITGRTGQRDSETHADLCAGTAPPGQRGSGCPPAWASGGGQAVLQRRTLRRPEAAAPYAG